MPDHPTRTTFHLSQDRQVLEARILARFRENESNPDYMLSYEELDELIGGDVSGDNNLSSKVAKSMRAVERMLDIKLGREPGKGIVRLPADQYVGFIDRQTSQVRRKSRRIATEAGRIASHQGVSQEARQQILARGSVAGAIAAFAGKRSIERVEHMSSQSDGPLSLNKTLDAFKKKA